MRKEPIEAEQKYPSGALGKPAFMEWHLDKGDIEKTAASLAGYLGGAALGGLGGAYLDKDHRARGAALGALGGLGAVGLGSAALRALEERAIPAAETVENAVANASRVPLYTDISRPGTLGEALEQLEYRTRGRSWDYNTPISSTGQAYDIFGKPDAFPEMHVWEKQGPHVDAAGRPIVHRFAIPKYKNAASLQQQIEDAVLPVYDKHLHAHEGEGLPRIRKLVRNQLLRNYFPESPITDALLNDVQGFTGYDESWAHHWQPLYGLNAYKDLHEEFTPEQVHNWAMQIPGVRQFGNVGERYDPSVMSAVDGVEPIGDHWITEVVRPGYSVDSGSPLVYAKVRVSDKPPTGSKLGSLSIAKTAGINAALSQLGIERVEGLTPYVKLAASRLDKEIRKGKLKYRDLDPGIPEGELPGFLIPAAKQRQRKALMAPSAADAETLARRRALNDALFNAQIKATAKDLGLPKVVINENLIPGSAPATTRGDVTQVHVGPTASRFLRPVVENPVRASFGIAPNLAPEAAVDSTLNKAILHHELGEARTVGQPVLTPHATHLGIDPILLENIHSQGDPEAQDFFKKLRQMHPDDALVSKLVKQVGGTPDSPIPLDSRRAKALRNALLANTNQLSKGTRARLVMEGIATPSKLPQVPETIRNIPETVVAALTNIGNRAESDDLRGAFRELYGVYPSLRDSAKYVIQGLAPNELSSLREIISRGIAQVPVAHPEQVTHPLRDALRAV